jgi:hypothetical protein
MKLFFNAKEGNNGIAKTRKSDGIHHWRGD